VQLEVFPIVANTMSLAFMPNFGFAIAAGTMIGIALGANDPVKARQLTHIVLCITAIIGGSVASFLYMSRHQWGYLFSKDKEVVTLTAKTLPVVALYVFLDCFGPGALVLILRGMNVVVLPAVVTFISFYLVGIPFGLWLTFKRAEDHWGIIGLWSGLTVGMFVMVSSLLVFLFMVVDWQRVAGEVHMQAQDSSVVLRRKEKTPLSEESVPEKPVAKDGRKLTGLKASGTEKSIIGKPSYEMLAIHSNAKEATDLGA